MCRSPPGPEAENDTVSKAGRQGGGSGLHFPWLAAPVFSCRLKYLQLRSISVGNHAYENEGAEQSAMAICWHFYKQGNICPGNDTFDVDPEVKTGDVLL